MYSKGVIDHFEHPRNAGELPDATAAVEEENPVCGDVLKLSAQIDEGRVVAVRFKAQGCVPAMACGSLLTTLMEGKNLEELQAITPEKIAQEIGGLPQASTHTAQLAADTLRILLSKLSEGE